MVSKVLNPNPILDFTAGGSGSGNASVGVLIRQDGESRKGIFVSHNKGDLTWHAQAESRGGDESASPALIQFDNQDRDASMNVSLPLDWQARPESANRKNIVYTRYENPFAGVKAQYEYGRLNVKASTVGTIGNRYSLRVNSGTAAVAETNAHADIPLYNGTPGVLRAGQIRVTSPDALGDKATLTYRTSVNLTAGKAGSAGNNISIRENITRNAGLSEDFTVAAVRQGNRINLTIVMKNFTPRPTAQSIADALNALVDDEGNQFVVATVEPGSFGIAGSISYGQTTDYRFSGGGGDGGGTATNTGGINLVSGDPSRTVAGATTVINVAPPGDTAVRMRLTYTGTSRGAAGNSRTANVGFDSSIGNNDVSITADNTDGDIEIDFGAGTVSLGSILTALTGEVARIGGGGSGFFVSAEIIENEDSVTTVTWGSSDTNHSTAQFSGGYDAGREPLSAAWDVDSHTLTVTALDSDAASDVITAITALDEFSASAGPGYVRLAGGGIGTGVVNVDNTVGNTLEYNFAGGVDGSARSTLAVNQTFIGSFQGASYYQLAITGILSSDSIQDVIDAYTSAFKRFELAPASGSTTASTLTGNSLTTTNLVGGQDSHARQLPSVTLNDNGVVAISLHAQDDATTNTTLLELMQAFRAVSYTNNEGTTVRAAQSIATIDISGGGSPNDPIRNQALPALPYGGRNEVMRGPVMAIARPDDEVDGPNILIRYDPATDTMANMIQDFKANSDSGFTFTLLYNTALNAVPEAVPWNRTFYNNGAEEIAGPSDGLTQTEVDSRVRLLTKGFALAGGPDVPDSVIDEDIARDDEVVSILKDAATTHNPSTAENDELYYFDSTGSLNKQTTDVWRSLFKGYVGPWSDTPGFFVFRPGDLTDSHGQLYYVNTTTTKNLSSGPETNADFSLLGNFGGVWADRYYKELTFVRHDDAVWVAQFDISQGDDPPGSNDNWHRVSEHPKTVRDIQSRTGNVVVASHADGTETSAALDGAPDSIVDVTIRQGELVETTRAGNETQHVLPGGGTNIEANPADAPTTDLVGLKIGENSYRVLGFHPVEIGSAAFGNTSNNNRHYRSHTSGDGIVKPDTVEDGEWWGFLSSDEDQVGAQIYIFPADRLYNKSAVVDVDATNNNGMELFLQSNRGIYLTWDSSDKLMVAATSSNTNIRDVNLYRIGKGASDTIPTLHPTITSFTSFRGDLDPVAGSIANQGYGVEWAIAQTAGIGSARVIGFKGSFSASRVTSLIGLAEVNWHGGRATAVIPSGITLAATETYTLRLQVFDSSITRPVAGSTPVAYQDIIITAHSASTANYHWTYIPYMSGDADAAATAARISFSNDMETGDTLAAAYDIDVPSDTNEYQLALVAKADQTQPTGFTSGGQNASGSFYAAQDITVSTVAYKAYIMKPLFRVTSSNNGQTIGVES